MIDYMSYQSPAAEHPGAEAIEQVLTTSPVAAFKFIVKSASDPGLAVLVASAE